MRPLADILKTQNNTGNTGNTGNAENIEPERESFRYIENRKLPEMENWVNLVSGETSLCGQMSSDEMTKQEPHREERRNPADYQGPESFETCFQKCLAEIAGRFEKLPWAVRFEKTPAGIRNKSLAEILGPDEYAIESGITDEINRLWNEGIAQIAADDPWASATYQEFRQAVIKWYRLWEKVLRKSGVSGGVSGDYTR